MIYLLYSTRSQGWLTRTSTYSTDISQAQHFNHDDAIEYMRRHRKDGNHNMLPVRLEDLE